MRASPFFAPNVAEVRAFDHEWMDDGPKSLFLIAACCSPLVS